MDHDGIAAQNFKVDAEGRIIFFPYGMYGKGRILPDRATAETVFTRQKQLLTFAIAAAGGLAGAYQTGLGFPWIIGITAVLAVVLGLLSWFSVHALVRDLPTTDEEYDFGDSINGPARLRWLLRASFGFVAVSVFILLVGKQQDHWIGWLGIAFFGTGFLLVSWQAIARRRRQRPASEPVQRFRQRRDSAVVSRNPAGFGKRKTPPGA